MAPHKNLLTASAAAIAASLSLAQAQMTDNNTADEAAVYADRQNTFRVIDTDRDEVITKDEFIAYAQEEQDMSRADAAALYEEITDEDDLLTMVIYQNSESLSAWHESRDENRMAAADQSSAEAGEASASSNEYRTGQGDDRTSGIAGASEDDRQTENMASNQMSAEQRDDDDADSLNRQTRAEQTQQAQLEQNQRRTQSQNVNEEEAGALNRNFAAIDDNGDRIVTQAEFTEFISGADNVTDEEAQRLFDVAAGDDKELTLAEFVDSGDELERVAEDIVGKPSQKMRSAMNSPDSDSRAASAMSARNGGDKPAQNEDQRAGTSRAQENEGERDPATALAENYGDDAVETAASIFEKMDADSDNRVSQSEYLEYTRKQARQSFDNISGNDDSISLSELRSSDKYGDTRKAEID